MAYTTPVTDRSLADLAAKNSKAYFNVSDWIRIYNNALYVNGLIQTIAGHTCAFTTIDTPTMGAIPAVANFNTLIANINTMYIYMQIKFPTLINPITTTTWVVGAGNPAPSYVDVNQWEKAIEWMYLVLTTPDPPTIWIEPQPIPGTTDPGWFDIDIDSDGSFIVALPWSASGNIPATSLDYGATWQSIAPINRSYTHSIACSQTGQYLVAIIAQDSIFVSGDYGATWTERNPYVDNNFWSCVDMSADGNTIIAGMDAVPLSGYRSRLVISTNRGVDWTEVYPAGSGEEVWLSVNVSGDGTHMVAAASYPTFGVACRVYLSANSGTSWSTCTALAGGSNWKGDINVDGSVIIGVQTTGFYPGATYAIKYSLDYGVTFGTVNADGATNRLWTGAAVSQDGKKMAICHYSTISGRIGRIYKSVNYGAAWTEEQPAGATDHKWKTVKLSGNGLNMAAGEIDPPAGKLYYFVGQMPVINHLVIDLAYGVPYDCIPALQQYAGLDGAIWRLGGGASILDDLTAQIATGLPFGVYFYLAPATTPAAHVSNLTTGLAALSTPPKFLAVDIELPGEGMTQAELSAAYQAITEAIKAAISPMPCIIYTSNGFVLANAPGMLDWMGDYIIWEANYTQWTGIDTPLTWHDFNTLVAATIYPVYDDYPAISFHQFVGDFVWPLAPHQIDYSQITNQLYQQLFR